MGVTLTMPEGHAILDCGAALDCIGEVAAARTKFNVSSLEVMAILWKRRLL